VWGCTVNLAWRLARRAILTLSYFRDCVRICIRKTSAERTLHVPTRPDRTGPLALLSRALASFGVLVRAGGASQTGPGPAGPAGHARIASPRWGMAVTYADRSATTTTACHATHRTPCVRDGEAALQGAHRPPAHSACTPQETAHGKRRARAQRAASTDIRWHEPTPCTSRIPTGGYDARHGHTAAQRARRCACGGCAPLACGCCWML
jgi:hypothetical protein